MERRKVRAQVVNANWECKKYEIRKRCNEVRRYLKANADAYAKCFVFGVGVATVFIIKDNL